MREVGVGLYDVAIGEDLKASVLSTKNAWMLGFKEVWLSAVNRTHQRILAKLGVDRLILAEREVGQHIAQMLHKPLVHNHVSLGNGFHFADPKVPEKLQGRRMDDAGLLTPST